MRLKQFQIKCSEAQKNQNENFGVWLRESENYSKNISRLRELQNIPIANGQDDIIDPAAFEHVVNLLRSESRHSHVIDLQNLISKLEAAHGGRATFSH